MWRSYVSVSVLQNVRCVVSRVPECSQPVTSLASLARAGVSLRVATVSSTALVPCLILSGGLLV